MDEIREEERHDFEKVSLQAFEGIRILFEIKNDTIDIVENEINRTEALNTLHKIEYQRKLSESVQE